MRKSLIIKKPKKWVGYREQCLKCDSNGNRIEVPCIKCNQINLICIKYKTYCNSKACFEERYQE